MSIRLLRKLDPSNELCNVIWLICRGFDVNIIHAKKKDNTFSNLFGNNFKYVYVFGMMIDKTKGQRISNVGVYLQRHAFLRDKLYVALFRATKRCRT